MSARNILYRVLKLFLKETKRSILPRQVCKRAGQKCIPSILILITLLMVIKTTEKHGFFGFPKFAYLEDECDWVKSVSGIPVSTINKDNNAPETICKPFTLPICGQANSRYCTHLHSKGCVCEKHQNCSATAPIPWVTLHKDKAMLNGRMDFTWRVHCNFSEIYRWDDYEYLEIHHRTILGDEKVNYYELDYTDVLNVSCWNAEARKNWSDILLVPMKNPRSSVIPNAQHLRSSSKEKNRELPMLNILIWMTDAISKNWFHRNMPKTLNYMKDSMGGILVDGFTQVGKNSLPNMIPFWTGLNSTSWLDPQSHAAFYVDDLEPMFIADYRKAGYVTAYYEESHASSAYDTVFATSSTYKTFCLPLHRFNKPPADYYSWPFMMNRYALTQEAQPLCFGDKGSNWHAQNYLKTIWKFNEDHLKMFFFAQGSYSHQSLMHLRVTDDDFVDFLQTWMNTAQVRNDTVVVFMSDHGNHILSPYYGCYEVESSLDNRMPLLYMMFPDWMDVQYPEQMLHLRENAKHRLTTMYDLGVTLKHLLHGVNEVKNTPGRSLFEPIPPERTCKAAGVPPIFCSCLTATPVKKTLIFMNMVEQLAEDTLPHINGYIKSMKWFFVKEGKNNTNSLLDLYQRHNKKGTLGFTGYSKTALEQNLEQVWKYTDKLNEHFTDVESCPTNLSSIFKICKVEGWVPSGEHNDHELIAQEAQFLAMYFLADPGHVQVKAVFVRKDPDEYLFQKRSFVFVPPGRDNDKSSDGIWRCMKAVRAHRRLTFA